MRAAALTAKYPHAMPSTKGVAFANSAAYKRVSQLTRGGAAR